MRQRVLLAVFTGLLGMPLVACSGDVEVRVPSRADQCGTLSWPATVGTAERRVTTPTDPAVAAWGDPAIIARCGQAPLAATTDTCVEVDGVDWVARELSDGTSMTTFGTDPALEVLIPQSYGPAPLLLPAFTAAASSLPTTGRHCS